MWVRELWLEAVLSLSSSWSPAAVAAAASPTHRTTREWPSYDQLLAHLSWQPAPTSSFLCSRWPKERHKLRTLHKPIDHFRYIKIQPNTIGLNTRLFGINPTKSVVIPQRIVLTSIACVRLNFNLWKLVYLVFVTAQAWQMTLLGIILYLRSGHVSARVPYVKRNASWGWFNLCRDDPKFPSIFLYFYQLKLNIISVFTNIKIGKSIEHFDIVGLFLLSLFWKI